MVEHHLLQPDRIKKDNCIMNRTLSLQLPKGWTQEQESFEENGVHLFRLFAQKDSSHIDIIAGSIPEGSSVLESAMSSYAEIFSIDTSSQDGLSCIQDNVLETSFKGSVAYGYQFEDKEGLHTRNIFTELLPGFMAMISVSAKSPDTINSVFAIIAKKMSVEMSF